MRRVALALPLALVAAPLAACSSSAKPHAAASISSPRPSAAASPSVIPLATPLASCPAPDAAALGAAIGDRWTLSPGQAAGAACDRVLKGTGSASLTITLSASASSASEVAAFTDSPPPVPHLVVLGPRGVGRASVAAAARNGTTNTFFVEVAEPTYLITLLVSLPDSDLHGASTKAVATKLATWASAQKPKQ